MSTNVPNLKQIGGGHRKTLVDLTWNDPQVKTVRYRNHSVIIITDVIGAKCTSCELSATTFVSQNLNLQLKSTEKCVSDYSACIYPLT